MRLFFFKSFIFWFSIGLVTEVHGNTALSLPIFVPSLPTDTSSMVFHLKEEHKSPGVLWASGQQGKVCFLCLTVCGHSEISMLLRLHSWGFHQTGKGFHIYFTFNCWKKACWCVKVISGIIFYSVYMNKFFHCCHWEFCKYRKSSETHSAMETLEDNYNGLVHPYPNICKELLYNVHSGNTVSTSIGVMQGLKQSCTKINSFMETTSSNTISGMAGIILLWLQSIFEVEIIVYTKVWWGAEINKIPEPVCMWQRSTKTKTIKTEKQQAICLQCCYN